MSAAPTPITQFYSLSPDRQRAPPTGIGGRWPGRTADNTLVIQPRGTELVEVIVWLLASVPPPTLASVKEQQTEKADKSEPHCDGADAMGPSKPLVVIVH